ncbi:hypothetical protein E2C01_004412 [Portunus trituberculatus]|uniref:Uncharacterized protein n=1 Tax=Portunus trituberculatus TaxID=210409 RepID=A0A5B7CRK1_PORTR|nr:hypothetical protein [Portunus trituberculatus]
MVRISNQGNNDGRQKGGEEGTDSQDGGNHEPGRVRESQGQKGVAVDSGGMQGRSAQVFRLGARPAVRSSDPIRPGQTFKVEQ